MNSNFLRKLRRFVKVMSRCHSASSKINEKIVPCTDHIIMPTIKIQYIILESMITTMYHQLAIMFQDLRLFFKTEENDRTLGLSYRCLRISLDTLMA